MKNIRLFPLLFFVLIFFLKCTVTTSYTIPKILDLTKGWKFFGGDNLLYSGKDFNDSSWQSIDVKKDWQSQGFDTLRGYGWYRIKVFIPSSLRKKRAADSLQFFMGFIYEKDQTYLNGKLLGENGVKVPLLSQGDTAFIHKPSGWLLERSYVLPIDDKRILWDQINTIAIRVYSLNDNGGLMNKFWDAPLHTPFIRMRGIDQDIVLDKSKLYAIKEQTGLDTTLLIKNTSAKYKYSGELHVDAINLRTKELIFNYKTSFSLSPLKGKAIPISLPYCTDSLRVNLLIDEDDNHLKIRDSLSLPSVLLK